jgi:hypothetical protein
MVGALISLMLIYGCALHLDCNSWFARQIILLGRYSLLGYLVQIALIQLMVRICGGKPSTWIGVIVVTATATVFLWLVVLGLHELRKRIRPVDGIYKAIFA